jgi:SSS family transporter
MSSTFAFADWLVIAAYVGILFIGGWYFTPKSTETSQEYFLAGNSIPAWLAAVSVLSATQSAATFLGGPDYGYRGDYTYLGTSLGGLIGAVFVAKVLIPRFYALRATTVYELLSRRFSPAAMRWAGGMFLLGRVLAGGARVYLAAIAVAMVVTFDVSAPSIVAAAALVVAASFLFTFVGGLRSVLWNDLIQFVIFVSAALGVLIYLRSSIPVGTSELIEALANTPEGTSKLRLFDLSTDPSRPFTLIAIITGVMLLFVANSGLDQDTTQRLLACKDARTGARGLYMSVLASIPVVGLFVTIGVLLYVFYQRPDLMGGDVASVRGEFSGEKISIFMHYILTELPPGLRGLVTAGVMAAAVATTNSALNAMSSVVVEDFYRPWRERKAAMPERHYVVAGRIGMGVIGVAMFLMAVLSYYWQRTLDMPLLEFALQVMVFAYAGLLGVYFTAVFTDRGSTASVIAALMLGFLTVFLLQPAIATAIGLPEILARLSFPYQLCIGTFVSTLVCALPGRTVAPILSNAVRAAE